MKLVRYGFIAIFIFSSVFASAHSLLKSSYPKNGQQLTEAPEV